MDRESRENRKAEMLRMRQEGYTLEEIGKKFGVSKQWVYNMVGKGQKHRAMVEKIIYKGIYELFVNDPKMSLHKLVRIARGKPDGQDCISRNETERYRRFLTGRTDAMIISTWNINNILKYTGKTYEEVFELRTEADV